MNKYIWKGAQALALKDQAENIALRTGILVIEGEAILHAAVDTGNMRGSISHEVDEANKEATVYTPVEYAPIVEIDQPFMRPALDNNQAKVLDLMGKIIGDKLKDVGK